MVNTIQCLCEWHTKSKRVARYSFKCPVENHRNKATEVLKTSKAVRKDYEDYVDVATASWPQWKRKYLR